MKIAIHQNRGSFSERWVAYCQKIGIEYKLVNAFDCNIIEQLKDCDALMWHHHHLIFNDVLTAKRILFSLQHAGIKVFPNFNTSWHFDDKVAQKYLLEAIGAPLVPSYVFYSKNEAISWANQTNYPKVFKLKGGAGSANVKLVHSKADAVRKIKKAFKNGFSQFDSWGNFKDTYSKFKDKNATFRNLLGSIVRIAASTDFAQKAPHEKGYVYFQDFIPNNDCDIRIIVIGNKAFGIKRLTREGDFRASGSGRIIYDPKQIDIRCVKIAFDINQRLQSQSISIDFVFDEVFNPLIVEISYGFTVKVYDPCEGFWDTDLNWHSGTFNPQEWMVENLITEINSSHCM